MTLFPALARSLTAAFGVALGTAACGGGSGHASSLQVSRTDNAGVWIVTTETSAADAPV